MTRTARALLLVVVAFLVISAALPADRARPWRVLPAGCLLVALGWTRRALAGTRRPAHPVREHAYADETPPPEQVVRLARLETAIRLGRDSRRQFERTLRPAIVALAEQRLADRHGIVPAARPEAARHLMGEELWQLYEEQRAGAVREGPGPAPDELDRLVRRVAAL